MKNNLYNYDYLLDINKLLKVYNIIKTNTKNKKKLIQYELFLSCNIITIYNNLVSKGYCHQQYNIFLIKEPKYRIIMSEVMSDKIVNHLVSKYILSPLIEPKLIPMNVAVRNDKETKKGIYYIKKYINKFKLNYDKFYVLKCDVTKYFYSIDHKILIEKLKKLLVDKDILKLITKIISSTNEEYINVSINKIINEEIKHLEKMNLSDMKVQINSLKSIPLYHQGKGLPIGNMTSQILAIFYLNDLDHYIKEQLQIKGYVRYMDDLILIHPNKDYLKYCLKKIEEKLKELKLTLNNKTQIVEVHQGFVFLGYKFRLKDKKLYILINSKTKKRIIKRIKILNKNKTPNERSVIASYKGYLKIANSGSFCYKHKI